jgi:hypothetical protein
MTSWKSSLLKLIGQIQNIPHVRVVISCRPYDLEYDPLLDNLRINHLVNNELVVREIAICIRLIDIFMENDAVYNMWLDRSFSGKLKFRKLDNGMYELDKSEERPISDFRGQRD